MNIGGYRPDGNLMTVPEIKEIVTEGVDISDLKDKVDTIQGNVTTLNEGVGELETGLAETISDLNDTNSLLTEKVSIFQQNEEYDFSFVFCTGFLGNSSKNIVFYIADNRFIESGFSYVLQDLSICVRSGSGYAAIYTNDGSYRSLGASPIPILQGYEKLYDTINNIIVEPRNGGLQITIACDNEFTSRVTVGNFETLTNNQALNVIISAIIDVS